ncbi:MAG: hypothetical protein VKJ64_17570 [Leptolyngbyaceae bacterium]|nr:hypothetical protein [Leptolyngbyaceae bacterium]
MSLAKDLLTQARQLATREPKRPKQASLRRAISAAYYSLFHLLTGEAAKLLLRGNELQPFQGLMRRAFNHSAMKTAARAFAGGTLTPKISGAFTGSISLDLMTVASAFVDLQDARHQADYDLSHSFTRRETLDLVEMAEDAFRRWQLVRKQVEAKAFLVMLLSYESLRKR